jgi:EAL domain-containing protein (putative c-di-GMP-specific phosphodiesterase class I)
MDRVKLILTETGPPGESLELEIPDSVIAQAVETAERVMRQLRSLGVHWAIDDFGTGYSTLDTHRRLPIERLKIDLTFVRAIPDDLEQTRIAEAIIALAHKMNFGVLAEGIENQEQATFLRRHGCDLGQGYLFGRPAAADDFKAYFPAVPSRQGRLALQAVPA